VIGEEEKKKPKLKDAVPLMKSQKTKEVDITLNPTELENLTDAVLQEKYENRVAADAQEKEDVSDVIAEHKKKKRAKDKAKDKKYKDFKF